MSNSSGVGSNGSRQTDARRCRPKSLVSTTGAHSSPLRLVPSGSTSRRPLRRIGHHLCGQPPAPAFRSLRSDEPTPPASLHRHSLTWSVAVLTAFLFASAASNLRNARAEGTVHEPAFRRRRRHVLGRLRGRPSLGFLPAWAASSMVNAPRRLRIQARLSRYRMAS